MYEVDYKRIPSVSKIIADPVLTPYLEAMGSKQVKPVIQNICSAQRKTIKENRGIIIL
jgi:hypothetical protein